MTFYPDRADLVPRVSSYSLVRERPWDGARADPRGTSYGIKHFQLFLQDAVGNPGPLGSQSMCRIRLMLRLMELAIL